MNPLQLRLQLSQRVPSSKMLSWSLFQLWPSLELWVLFSFSAPASALWQSHTFSFRNRLCSRSRRGSLGSVQLVMLSSLCQDRLADLLVLLESVPSGWVHGHCETFNGLPRVTGVGFHGSQIMAFKRVVSQRRLSTSAFQRTTTNHAFRCTDQMLIMFCCHVRAKCLRAMRISSLLTSAPGRPHATASPTSKTGFR